MRRKERLLLGALGLVLLLLVLSMGGSQAVQAASSLQEGQQEGTGEAAKESTQERPEKGTADTGQEEDRENSWTGKLLDDMDLDQVQESVNSLLQEESFDFQKTLGRLLKGEDLFTKEAIWNLVEGVFLSKLQEERTLLLQILLLVLAAAVFYNLSQIFENNHMGEVSFYVVYLLLFLLLVRSFTSLSRELSRNLELMIEFMKGLAPAYFLAVAAAGGAVSGAAFYQFVLILVWGIQWVLLRFLLPAANLYVLLRLVNHLSKEEMLSKLSDLVKTIIDWGLRTLLGVVTGMQIIKSMVAPVMDSLKRSAIGKTAGAIPGVGNAVNAVTEIVLTSAVLVRNCMGVAFLVILVMWGLKPVLHYGMLSFFYRLAAALGEPVSDKRLIGALGTLGEGTGLLLRIFLDALVLCMITIAVLAVSFGG